MAERIIPITLGDRCAVQLTIYRQPAWMQRLNWIVYFRQFGRSSGSDETRKCAHVHSTWAMHAIAKEVRLSTGWIFKLVRLALLIFTVQRTATLGSRKHRKLSHRVFTANFIQIQLSCKFRSDFWSVANKPSSGNRRKYTDNAATLVTAGQLQV